MELRQVRYFVAVAEELHFGRAAERLHIAQPTVSQHIRRLERELRLELFHRTTRQVTLTPAGAAFLPHARTLLAAEHAALHAMADIRAREATVLRIGTSVGLGVRLERVLTSLADRSPELTVELVSATPTARLQAVRDGTLDAAFVRGLPHSPGLDLLPLWTDPLVVALPAAHPLAVRASVPLAGLAGIPLRLVSREANPQLVDLVLGACQDAGFEPVLGPAFTTDQDTLAAIATGSPSWTVFYAAQARFLPTGRTVFRPVDPPGLTAETYLAVHPATPARRLAPLLDVCRAVGD
ncbi:putative LysR family transcriptional regulator [Streptomyces sp. NBRC 110611]|uniref:LysR substrate-binding domain-containing protein n=1 Tax=Streptomyces sp. NBRC 110611 TaxID=1621259 RepID=UPI0008298027|nr:LysR family transcriptional regulator [Streptomyces sp. NBRC 110611]GAU69296.1 putative LysR family transcriptional regulator [Streptomyces sp. NBRC 110611]